MRIILNILLVLMIIINIILAAITKNIQALLGWLIALMYVISDVTRDK
jgi:hypothetical protein